MRSPEVTLDNWDAVAEHYAAHRPNERFMKVFHNLCAKAFKPEVSWGDGAEAAVNRHFENGGQVMLAMNHLEWVDPCNAAAIVQNETALHPIIGNVAIPGNAPYFNNRYVGWIIRNSGVAVPVARKKDVYSEEGLADNITESERKCANEKIMHVMIERMNSGSNGAIYPEGTRNRNDPREVAELHDGVITIVQNMDNPENVMYVCMGTSYQQREFAGRSRTDIRHPRAHLDYIPAQNTADLNKIDLRDALQSCVDVANRS